MKKLTKLMLVLAQMGLIGAVNAANVVALDPTSKTVTSGTNVSFDITLDFGTATSGGRFNLIYDPAILGLLNPNSTSFSYNSDIFKSPSYFTYTPSFSNGSIIGIGFLGTFSGSATLGTVTFSTSSVTGIANLQTAEYSDEFYQFSNIGRTSLLPVTYGKATAQVSAVPIPAALWLMASGLSALGLGMRRRRA